MRYRSINNASEIMPEEYILTSMFFPVEGSMEYEAILANIPEIEKPEKNIATVDIDAAKIIKLKKIK